MGGFSAVHQMATGEIIIAMRSWYQPAASTWDEEAPPPGRSLCRTENRHTQKKRVDLWRHSQTRERNSQVWNHDQVTRRSRHLEVMQQVPAGDFGAADLLLHQVLGREQSRDQLHQLLLELLVDV